MKQVTRYTTLDGKEHATREDASKHLDKLYGDLLCKVARHLSQIDKYTAMTEWLDDNLSVFAELQQIRDDNKLIDDSED